MVRSYSPRVDLDLMKLISAVLLSALMLAFAAALIQPAASISSVQPDGDVGAKGSTIEFHTSERYSNQSSSSSANQGPLFGRDTWIKNQRSGASMSNEVSGAHSMNGEMAVSAVDSNSWGYYGHSGMSNMQMSLNEDITDGRVHIGALQGEAQDIWGSAVPPSATMIKDPKLEIDEDYVGTYHIEKNMTMSMPYGRFLDYQDWLPCCSQGYFDGENIRWGDAGRIFG